MNVELERIDPNVVPKRKLYNGAEIPAVGLGTFGSDRFTADQIAEAVLGAIAPKWQSRKRSVLKRH